jgi:hypothetical protein
MEAIFRRQNAPAARVAPRTPAPQPPAAPPPAAVPEAAFALEAEPEPEPPRPAAAERPAGAAGRQELPFDEEGAPWDEDEQDQQALL